MQSPFVPGHGGRSTHVAGGTFHGVKITVLESAAGMFYRLGADFMGERRELI